MAQTESAIEVLGGMAPGIGGAVDAQRLRVSVAHYTADEVIRPFLGLYACLDFKAELEDIGVTRMQFLRRKKALREFRAISVALWGLALQKSFPNDAVDFFAEFRDTGPILSGRDAETARMQERVDKYIELLVPKGDTDFSPLADSLAQTLALHARDVARLRLRLALIIRNLYVLIFDKLV